MRYGTYLTKTNWRVLLACLTLLGVGSLGLVLSGCSSNELVVTEVNQDYVSFFDQPYFPDAVAKRTDFTSASYRYVTSRLEASLGGVMALNDNVDIEAFVVMPVSFPADTTFTVTITKLVTADGEEPIIYDFGPDGLQFSKPAVLRLNVAQLYGPDVSSISFYYLNEKNGMWVYLESYAADDGGYAYAPVDHFSNYCVARASDKIAMVK